MTENPNPVPSEVEGPPKLRTFSLNSQEFYDIACPRQDQPWILNGPFILSESKGRATSASRSPR